MEDSTARRKFLTTASTVVAFGSAGCSEIPSGIGQNSGIGRTVGQRDENRPDEWPTLGQNPQNTKFNHGGAGPKDEPNVDWTYESENIFAPPAMAGGSIGLSGVEHLTVLNPDGSYRWSVEYRGLLDETRPNTFPVTLTNDIVCSSIRRNDEPARLVGYNHDGEPRWTVDLGEVSAGAGTPFVTHCNGVVYVTLPVRFSEFNSIATILTVDVDSGEILWSKNFDTLLPIDPVITERLILLPTGDEQLLALDKETGELEWEFELLDRHIPRPVVSDGTIYAQYGNDTVGLSVDDGSISLDPTDSFGGKFAFVDNVVIQPANDTLRAYDLQGDKLLWEQEYSASLSPPAVADGVAYVGGEDKRIRGVEIASGDELWSRQLGDDVMRPIVAQGRVLAVSGDTLYSLS